LYRQPELSQRDFRMNNDRLFLLKMSFFSVYLIRTDGGNVSGQGFQVVLTAFRTRK